MDKLKGIDDESMKNICAIIEDVFGHDNNFDADGLQLSSKMQLLRKSLPNNLNKTN